MLRWIALSWLVVFTIAAFFGIGCSRVSTLSPVAPSASFAVETGGGVFRARLANPLPNGHDVELWFQPQPGALTYGARLWNLWTGAMVATPGNIQPGHSISLDPGHYAWRVRSETPTVGQWVVQEEFSVGLGDGGPSSEGPPQSSTPCVRTPGGGLQCPY